MRNSRLLLTLTVGLAVSSLVLTAPSSLASKKPSKTQIMDWINKQAKNPVVSDNFDFQLVNLDDDPEPEIAAKHNGSVHIGSFYVLDQKPDRTYALIAEEEWNPPRLQLDHWDYTREINSPAIDKNTEVEPRLLAEKRVFETVQHTGGSGISVYQANLWYLDKGRLVKAWEGLLRETVSVPGGQLFRTVGSYQIVHDDEAKPLLYHWQTKQELNPDTGELLPGKPETTLQMYRWENGVFVPLNVEKPSGQ
ncbi:hypothetical protein HPY27_26060 [Brevibacillus sp. HB1.1]|uniref:hypothetical protein n=1 Tax=Brevibacillus sp. HB1.1 TaxID=2738808 RepID=UPI001575BCC0|nr:hypothetical protein [Brevibacillus sp. HB1.1]NTU33628.1 hypothetical protein [Brevibacillus sp. HB1.1]